MRKDKNIRYFKKKLSSLLKSFWKVDGSTFKNNKLIENTNAMLATFEPNAFPTAILDFSSKVLNIDIKISGADVAIPINNKLDIK